MSQIHATVDSQADAMISAAVRGLIAQRRTSPTQVAVALGVSRAALYRKLGGDSPWQAAEVDRLARFFTVTRDSLYEGCADFVPNPRPSTDGLAGSLTPASARSSTDRASDYGSGFGRTATIIEFPLDRTQRRIERRRSHRTHPFHAVASSCASAS